MLFSDPEVLARKLEVDSSLINAVLAECGEPEDINNSPNTAPSKRLDALIRRGKFQKTAMGITIAQEIGIKEIRTKCPVFNQWLTTLETLPLL